ncbi:MAG TPA: DUF333 domain-containing protein [Patescibacteria group bacterium]|nr:DUF333 domain-containing protein [Patescibacteria group bacterium]
MKKTKMNKKNILLPIFACLVLAIGLFLVIKHFPKKNNLPTTTSSNQKSNLANPASVNCEKQGGQTVIMTMGNGGQYGLCQFADNMACEEWAMMRGQCPVGGIKTTGYDNIQQMYCVWIGGKTLATPNANCTLPDGTVCPVDSLYNGTCPSNL